MAKSIDEEYMWRGIMKQISFSIVLVAIGCTPLTSSKSKDTRQDDENVKEIATVDEDGVATGKVTASSTESQRLSASATAAAKGTAVTFPPGSLSVDTDISLGDGDSLLSAGEELLGTEATGAASVPVELTSTAAADAAAPFTIAIPMNSAGLHALVDTNQNVVVVYKVIRYDQEGKEFIGVLLRSEFEVSDGEIVFATKYFGTYQAVVTEQIVEEKKEVDAEEIEQGESDGDSDEEPDPPTPALLTLSVSTSAGSAAYASTAQATFTVTNTGESAATGLTFSAVSAPYSFASETCGSTLAAAANCQYVIGFTSPGEGSYPETLTVTYHDGSQQRSVDESVAIAGTAGSVSVAKIYSSNGNWNDYVKRTNTTDSLFDQPDTSCVGTETITGGPDACLHGGEFLKVVLSEPSCSDLEADDNLGAFTWRCITLDSQTTFVTRSLKAEVGLGNLITATGWLSNFVSIKKNGVVILKSSPATWWSNTVEAAPDSSSSAQLLSSHANKIVTYSAGTDSYGYIMNSNNMAFVVLPGNELKFHSSAGNNCNSGESGGSAKCALAAGTQTHLWIEGDFDGNATAMRIVEMVAVSYSRVKNVNSRGANHGSGAGLWMEDSKFNRVQNVESSNHQGRGFYVYKDSDSNFFTNLTATNNTLEGMYANVNGTYPEDNVFFNFLTAANGQAGLKLGKAQESTFFGTLILNSGSHGFHFHNNADNNTFVNLGIVNSVSNGLYIATNDLNNNKFYGTYAVHNGGDGVHVVSSTTSEFHEYLIVGQNGDDCDDNSTGGLGIDTNCAANASSTHTLVSSATLASSYVGAVTSDGTNPDHTNGEAAPGSIDDWYNFDSYFRYWDEDGGSSVVDSALRGRCGAGTCEIIDLSLDSGDSFLLNKSTNSSGNPTFVNSAACIAALDGSNKISDQLSTPNTFLKFAVEIIGDSEGDDDGLCESDESCIYTPNFGLYQGSGDHAGNSCQFQDGSAGEVQDVTMYRFPLNGI